MLTKFCFVSAYFLKTFINTVLLIKIVANNSHPAPSGIVYIRIEQEATGIIIRINTTGSWDYDLFWGQNCEASAIQF